MSNFDLFPHLLPRAPKRRVLMHVCEGVVDGPGRPRVKLSCKGCGAVTGWKVFDSAAKARQGLECDICNQVSLPPVTTKQPSAKELLALNKSLNR